jgi:hypothetical protein
MDVFHTGNYHNLLLLIYVFCILSCTTAQGGATIKEQTREPQSAVLNQTDRGTSPGTISDKKPLGTWKSVYGVSGGLAQKKNEQAANPVNSGIANKDYSDLLAKAHAAGSVRIIVRLDMPFVSERLLTTQEAVDQQTRISRLQDQLCAALAKYNVKGIKRFKYTPYLGMEVDSTALAALISNPLVTSIEEDAPAPPT